MPDFSSFAAKNDSPLDTDLGPGVGGENSRWPTFSPGEKVIAWRNRSRMYGEVISVSALSN